MPTFPTGPPGSIYPDVWLGPIAYSQNYRDVDPLAYDPVLYADDELVAVDESPLAPEYIGVAVALNGIPTVAKTSVGILLMEDGTVDGLLIAGISIEQAAAIAAANIADITAGTSGYDLIALSSYPAAMCFELAVDDAGILRVDWDDDDLATYQAGVSPLITSVGDLVDRMITWGFATSGNRAAKISTITTHANTDGASVLNAGWAASPGATQTWIQANVVPAPFIANFYIDRPFLMTQFLKAVRMAVFPLTPPVL